MLSFAVKLCIRLWLTAALLFITFQSERARTSIDAHFRARDSTVTSQDSTPTPKAQSQRYTSKFTTVSGTRLHYIIQGAGQTVVLIHGNPGSAQDWLSVFTPLTARHKVVSFDRPGHGRSERPKHGDATVEVQAALIHEVLAALHVERPILVGHSWGALLALAYAINYPAEVAGLVLVAPAVYEDHNGSFLTGLPTMPVIGDAANYMLTPLIGASVVRGELKKAFSPDPVPRNYLKSVLSEWTKPSKVRAYAMDEDLYNPAVRKFSPRYSELAVPLTIIAGDSDLIVPVKENAERLHEAVPKSGLVILPKTGHQIPFTRPQTIVDEIERVQRLVRGRG
jgi:pimeloyl-ACP methyl ester carboxylesterase